MDGKRDRRAYPLEYEDCTPPDIGFFNPAGKIYCMNNIPSEIELKGHYHSKNFNFIQIVLELCPAYSKSLEVECLSATEMKQYFEE